MKPFYATLTVLIALLTLLALPIFAFADTGTLGLTYGAGGGNTDIGALGSYKTPIHVPVVPGELEADGQLKWGQGVDAAAHLSYRFDVYESLGLKPFLDFTGKGTSLDVVGGTFDGGLSGDFTIGAANVGIGVFGRASAEFAPTLRDELLAAGVNGVTPEMLSDPDLDAPATDGLPVIRPDTPLHITAYTGFDWNRFDVQLRWMGEASLDTPIHQFRIDMGTSFDVGIGEFRVGEFGVQCDVIVQAHEGNIDGEYNALMSWLKRWE